MAWIPMPPNPLTLAVGVAMVVEFFVSVVKSAAKYATWNLALLTLTTVAIASFITGFISRLTSVVADVIASSEAISFVPYFLPDNLGLCAGAYFGLKIAGTVFVRGYAFIQNKTYILKA
jgi:hypothetical protein